MKSVLHYVILVGIPILGVIGLLQIGMRLTPPASFMTAPVLVWIYFRRFYPSGPADTSVEVVSSNPTVIYTLTDEVCA